METEIGGEVGATEHPVLFGKEIVPGGFLIDEGGGPYIIVNHEEFVDPMGQRFRFSSYPMFVKSSMVPDVVRIEVDGPPVEWRALMLGSLVMNGDHLLIRAGAGDHFYSIREGAVARDFWVPDHQGPLVVEPLKVTLKYEISRSGSKVVWKPRYQGDPTRHGKKLAR